MRRLIRRLRSLIIYTTDLYLNGQRRVLDLICRSSIRLARYMHKTDKRDILKVQKWSEGPGKEKGEAARLLLATAGRQIPKFVWAQRPRPAGWQPALPGRR